MLNDACETTALRVIYDGTSWQLCFYFDTFIGRMINIKEEGLW